MVNFLNFEYVLTIHKAGTIRAAADELYISPQALSEHLGKLERELGTPLFHRTKPLTLTEAGEEFLSCAEACLEARRRLDTKLSSIAQRDNQRIALGVPTGMPPPLLLSFLDYFQVTSTRSLPSPWRNFPPEPELFMRFPATLTW